MKNPEALFKISYGLYIVCSGDKNKGNGYISNTVFQVSAEPVKFAACCSKKNLTAEFIKRHGTFSVSILEQNASSEVIGKFGFKSGSDIDKMSGSLVKYGETGVPIILDNTIAFFECKVVETIDTGTHLMYIGELVSAEIIDETKEPLTYLYYRQVKKGVSPKNAPTYFDKSKIETKPEKSTSKQYKCLACGYVYDDTSENIKFSDLPDDWTCPVCYSEKSDFYEL